MKIQNKTFSPEDLEFTRLDCSIHGVIEFVWKCTAEDIYCTKYDAGPILNTFHILYISRSLTTEKRITGIVS